MNPDLFDALFQATAATTKNNTSTNSNSYWT